MHVYLIQATPEPMDMLGRIAGICYGKDDASHRRVATCVKAGHTSVLEHAVATWYVDGISRACSHQLVRHRIASYTQQSQRYVVERENMPCALPESIAADPAAFEVYDHALTACDGAYHQLVGMGVRAEDARYVLQNAVETKLFVTMNARALFNFLDLRDDTHAQWEIRELAQKMAQALADSDAQWAELLALRGEA